MKEVFYVICVFVGTRVFQPNFIYKGDDPQGFKNKFKTIEEAQDVQHASHPSYYKDCELLIRRVEREEVGERVRGTNEN